MEFTDLVNELGYNISFEAISEPRIEGAKLRIIVNRSEDTSDLLIFPHPDSKVKTFQIDFPNYITYSYMMIILFGTMNKYLKENHFVSIISLVILIMYKRYLGCRTRM